MNIISGTITDKIRGQIHQRVMGQSPKLVDTQLYIYALDHTQNEIDTQIYYTINHATHLQLNDEDESAMLNLLL
jgi:hypothetical protein